jgi:predicted amidohydrolase YtcJ
MNLVTRVLPARTAEELSRGLDRAQREANRYGLTTLFAATADEPALRTYAAADRAGRLTVRVVAAAYPDPGEPDSILPRARAWRARYATARVRPIAVKLFQDGVIEARTAALLAPYLDRGNDAGTPVYPQDTLDRLVAGLDDAGFQVHVHAIGDRAIRMALDAFARAREVNGPRDARHAITHLELIDPADIPRFRALGVVANFEALWANGDEYLTALTEPAPSSPAGATGRSPRSIRCRPSRSGSPTARPASLQARRGTPWSGSICRPCSRSIPSMPPTPCTRSGRPAPSRSASWRT